MSTRAAQIELILGPLHDPLTGGLCAGYTAYFYATGTSTAKNVWTEPAKTNPYTSYELDSGGKALLYGDGTYKIVVKNLDGAAVLTLDPVKVQATTYSVVTKVGTYTATPDDDVILCNGTFTVNLQTVANFEHPLTLKNIGSGTITIDPYSTQTIDGDSTYTFNSSNETITIYPDVTGSTWRKGPVLDIASQPEITTVAVDDYILVYDTSASRQKQVSQLNLMRVYYVSAYASLTAAIAAISTTDATLVIDIDSAVAADMEFLATCKVRMENQSVLTIANGMTLTISGEFECGRYTCFAGTGTVSFASTFGPAEAAWWGFSAAASAATNNAAIAAALAACGSVQEVRPGTYATSSPITISTAYQKLHFGLGVVLSYSGTAQAILFSGVSNAEVTGEVDILCTNDSGDGVLFYPTVAAHCFYNKITFHTIMGNGRGEGPSTLSNVGIEFDRTTGAYAAYYNHAQGLRIADFNACIKFDCTDAQIAQGANANKAEGIVCDNYWYGTVFRALEDAVINCEFYGAAGSGSDYTIAYYFDNAAIYNKVEGGGGEPGALSRPYYVNADCNYNSIQGNFKNFAAEGVNLGRGNKIEIGYDLYKGWQIADDLEEDVLYRIGEVVMTNTNATTTVVRWMSRNATTGEYSAGLAKIMAYATGGTITVLSCTNELAESNQTYDQTSFWGVITTNLEMFLVFRIRDRGGADTNTRIWLDVDTLGTGEFVQTGPTVEASTLTLYALHTVSFNISLADNGTQSLPKDVEGFGTVYADGEALSFTVKTDGTVTLIAGTTNTAITDSDGDLCVYDGGTAAIVKNALGAPKRVKGVFTFGV